MATAERHRFVRDQSGAALLEFTIIMMTFLVMLFGVIEISLAFWQWNSATKALQVGARMASVSAPVWQQLATLTGAEGGGKPGAPLDAGSGYAYSVTCNGAASTCTGTTPGGVATTYNAAAMNRIVFGRGDDGSNPIAQCGNGGSGGLSSFGMCDNFKRIRPVNVIITYEHTNSGYATRPGGLVPTIRIQLTGLTFQFVFLDDLLGLGPITIPGLTTTLIGEDLRSGAPTF